MTISQNQTGIRALENKLDEINKRLHDIKSLKQIVNFRSQVSSHIRAIEWNSIIHACAEAFDVEAQEIIRQGRRSKAVDARFAAMTIIHETSNAPLEEIGKFFDNRTYGAVFYALNASKDRADSEPFGFGEKLKAIRTLINKV